MVSTRCAVLTTSCCATANPADCHHPLATIAAALFEPYFVTYDADPESYASLPAVFARIIKL